ncbi:MAG TPA: SRPBCC family protein [Polyangiaceae bacterium]|nr:SRPBCC family protein [Polyangiaceae bacterium]
MTDKIEKTTILKAPLAKVWNAISDSAAFGTWFGMTLEGPFVEGQTVSGAIAKTQVDDEIAKHQEPYVGMRCDLKIERIVPLSLLAFRWHPGAEPDMGPNAPTTLVTFELEEVAGGTRLTITESGFDALPLERRAKAFADNEGGWEAQLGLVAKYLARQV